MYLANPCGSDAVIRQMASGNIGLIDAPASTGRAGVSAAHEGGAVWCADNGCFSDKWDEAKWWQFLVDNAHRASTCLFAVAPDVVGDAQATLERSSPWLAKIRALGYPVAFVAQDGLGIHWNGSLHVGDLDGPTIEWAAFDCLFIGGTTTWKLGPHVRSLVAEAKRRGKWVHCGRVNSERRWRYADAIGCDSADGTFLTFGPDVNLPKLLAWVRNNDQAHLFGGPS